MHVTGIKQEDSLLYLATHNGSLYLELKVWKIITMVKLTNKTNKKINPKYILKRTNPSV